jgi:hypothetical protein
MKLVQYIKGRSSRRLQEEFPTLRKRYWGQHLWARGYFCATVGAVDEDTIKAYIENQKWVEDDQGLKITAPTSPRAGYQLGHLQTASAVSLDFQSPLNLPPLGGSRLEYIAIKRLVYKPGQHCTLKIGAVVRKNVIR